MSTAADAAAWLAQVQRRLPQTTSAGIEAALDDLIRALEPVTPVVSGRMRASYAIGTDGPDAWFLLNTAESPDDGYPYPARVVDDPHWSRAYPALNEVLTDGADRLGAALDLAITRLVHAF